MKTNIILIGWHENMTKMVAKRLAIGLELYYADVEDLIEYYLTNKEEDIEKVCGKDYLEGLKSNIMTEISNYENSIVYLPLHIFVNDENYEKLKLHGVVVFIDIKDRLIKKVYAKDESRTDAEKRIDTLALENRIAICREVCDIDVYVNKQKEEKAYKAVKKAVRKYYLEQLKRKNNGKLSN